MIVNDGRVVCICNTVNAKYSSSNRVILLKREEKRPSLSLSLSLPISLPIPPRPPLYVAVLVTAFPCEVCLAHSVDLPWLDRV